MKVRLIALFLVCGVLSGCGTIGPIVKPDFEEVVRRDVPGLEGKIVHRAPGVLLYGVDGFNLFSMWAATSPVFAQGRFEAGPGIFAFTEKHLYFAMWQREKYELVWGIEYDKITSIELRSFGLGRRIVLSLNIDPKVTSLHISDNMSGNVDPKASVETCQVLATLARNTCKLPPSAAQ
jgi:hypothetical protein